MGEWARPGTAPPASDHAAGVRAPTGVRRVAQTVRSAPSRGSIATVDWGFIWLMFALKIPYLLSWLANGDLQTAVIGGASAARVETSRPMAVGESDSTPH